MNSRFIILLFAIMLINPFTSFAEDIADVIFSPFGNKIKYLGQYSDNHKQKNGLGIEQSGGSITCGSFSHNKPHGMAMKIMGSKDFIENAPGAMAYIGRWFNGKKEGQGACFAPNGDIIYQGRFSNDKPVDAYPSANSDVHCYFNMQQSGDKAYIGAVIDGEPEGMGLYIDGNSLYVGTSRGGLRKGLGIFIYDDDVWTAVNWEGNGYTVVTTSDDYNNRRQIMSERKSAINSDLNEQLYDVLTGLAETALQLNEQIMTNKAKNQIDASSTVFNDTNWNSGGSKQSSKKTSPSSGKNDCGTSWMNDKRSYSNYESQLIKNGLSESDYKSIQRKMRKIREKWEARGCQFTKSPYE